MTAIAMHWLPGDPPTPCPDLLTREEAIRYLRLDVTVKDAHQAFNRLRETGELAGIGIGNRVMFRREDLVDFLDKRMETKPR